MAGEGAGAEAEIRRLEADLYAGRRRLRSGSGSAKDEASGIAASHDRARQDYEEGTKTGRGGLSQDRTGGASGQGADPPGKLKGITSDRILSLESFGMGRLRTCLC